MPMLHILVMILSVSSMRVSLNMMYGKKYLASYKRFDLASVHLQKRDFRNVATACLSYKHMYTA